ncbi:MAG TPA: hypothetical protein VFW63_04355 [Acidimicrobiales bacterium]|nr:hypothetical protein [Acidimicrobiales bacterium]
MTTDDDAARPSHLLDEVVSRAADVFLYAPIGLFFESPALVTKLAEQGRLQTRNARLFGQLAVRRGEAEVRRRVDEVEEQAVAVLRLLGLAPDEAADEGPAPTPAPPPDDAGGSATAPGTAEVDAGAEVATTPATPGRDAAELAIPDYDSLSASQVVTRLDGLAPDELEAVRAYEAANRGRKTILNKVAQLQA